MAEDADAAMTFQRLGYAVLHENHAICDTEAPETLVPLLKQRKRWMFGNFQVMWKNQAMLLPAPVRHARHGHDALFDSAVAAEPAVPADPARHGRAGSWRKETGSPSRWFAAVVLVMHTIIAIIGHS